MKATLLLRSAGPMQSWGTRSRFSHRDTESEPSKSGIVGLLAAALGRERSASIEDLASLSMAVRIDSPGRLEVDYQTALEVAKANGSTPDTVLSLRHFLADADFLIALTGDSGLLLQAHRALLDPCWPLFLGRKGHVPGRPVHVPHGLIDDCPPLEALCSVDWPTENGAPAPSRDAVIECAAGEEGDVRVDVPQSFELGRRGYSERRVRRIVLTPRVEPA